MATASRRGVSYHTCCNLCKAEGEKTYYIDEIGRSIREWYNEHRYNASSKKGTSHMKTHRALKHSDVNDAASIFSTSVINLETCSLVRKVREVVLIREYVGDLLLNDKLEYKRCLLLQLTTKVL